MKEQLQPFFDNPLLIWALALGTALIAVIAAVGVAALRAKQPKPKLKNGDIALMLVLTFGLILLSSITLSLLFSYLRLPESSEFPLYVMRSMLDESLSLWRLTFSHAFQATFNVACFIGISQFFITLAKPGDNPVGLKRSGFSTGVLIGAALVIPIAPLLLGFNLLSTLGLTWMGHDLSMQDALQHYLRLINPPHWPALTSFALAAVVGAPLLEELIFRGLIFRALASKLPMHLAAISSGLLFGLVHQNLASFCSLSLFGYLLAVVYYRTNNLWICIFVHALFNSTSLILPFLQTG